MSVPRIGGRAQFGETSRLFVHDGLRDTVFQVLGGFVRDALALCSPGG